MNRREFLASATCLAVSGPRTRRSGAVADDSGGAEGVVRVKVNTRRPLGTTPADFVGLGYEISSVARVGLLSAQNRNYVKLVRTLGASGVIRVGGNTSDFSRFVPGGESVSAPKGTVMNEARLRELGSFLEATGWRLIWGLNLGGGTEHEAVEEARAVMAVAKDKLLAFEIGNEPDLFDRSTAHRPEGYTYESYLSEYRRYKAAIRAELPSATFAGPDVAAATDWVTRFAVDEGNDLKLLTHHYYRDCAKPTSTLDELLHTDPKLGPQLAELRAASMSSHVPYRICETNSFCGGGKPGVSDTFGSALWALDYMFTLASAGAAGVNMETGVNQLGFISSYSPIGDDEHGTYSARPEYYGLLAFAQSGMGQRVEVDFDAQGGNLTAYAVLRDQKRLVLTLINKGAMGEKSVSIEAERKFRRANVLRLAGPSLESRQGVMLGGSAVSAGGDWKARVVEALAIRREVCEVRVPAASAAMVMLED